MGDFNALFFRIYLEKEDIDVPVLEPRLMFKSSVCVPNIRDPMCPSNHVTRVIILAKE